MSRMEVYQKRRGCGCIPALILLVLALVLVGVVVFFRIGDREVQQQTFTEPLDDIQNADVEIRVGPGRVVVNALGDSTSLINAQITHVGELTYDVSEKSGGKRVLLTNTDSNVAGLGQVFNSLDFGLGDSSDTDLLWSVDLSPQVPIALAVEGGAGALDLNLDALQIADLQVKVGAGGIELALPAPQASYRVEIEGSVGGTEIILPEGAAVRLEAAVSVGGIDVPDNLAPISQEEDVVGEGGIWQTAGFEQAEAAITIAYTGSVGDLTIRYV